MPKSDRERSGQKGSDPQFDKKHAARQPEKTLGDPERDKKPDGPPGLVLARVRHNPLRLKEPQCPIDELFRPYYERAMNGDLRALVEFYKENWQQADLGGAFYECIGYLAATGFPAHRKVVRAIERIDSLVATPAGVDSYRFWYKELYPLAREAKSWIQRKQAELKRTGDRWNRQKLWDEYVHEDPPRLSEKTITEENFAKAAGERIAKASAAESAQRRRVELQRLVSEPGQNLHDSVRRALRADKIPKQLFFALAQSNPNVPPALAVRQFACKLAGISESLVSHKALRKK